MTRTEAIAEMKRELKRDKDLTRRILINHHYMGENDKKFICPFHNDKDPYSTGFKKGSGKCFSCGAYFDAVDLIEHIKGLDFNNAVIDLWTNELGMPLPDYFPKGKEQRTKGPSFFSFYELSEIGLDGSYNISVKEPANICSYREGKMIEEGKKESSYTVGERNEEGDYVLYKKSSYPSLYDMYKEDPIPVLQIIMEKAYDYLYLYKDKLHDVQDPLTETGRICANDLKWKKDFEKELIKKISGFKDILYKAKSLMRTAQKNAS